MSLILTSADFTPGGPIPAIHTCDGANTSPALSWSGARPTPAASSSSWTTPTRRIPPRPK